MSLCFGATETDRRHRGCFVPGRFHKPEVGQEPLDLSFVLHQVIVWAVPVKPHGRRRGGPGRRGRVRQRPRPSTGVVVSGTVSFHLDPTEKVFPDAWVPLDHGFRCGLEASKGSAKGGFGKGLFFVVYETRQEKRIVIVSGWYWGWKNWCGIVDRYRDGGHRRGKKSVPNHFAHPQRIVEISTGVARVVLRALSSACTGFLSVSGRALIDGFFLFPFQPRDKNLTEISFLSFLFFLLFVLACTVAFLFLFSFSNRSGGTKNLQHDSPQRGCV
mmetsp:Transcript_20554/g.42239  ORF Transcript_20554/g.42239 Transcript_20554/m.42239 type:complete len:272 (+) Transcript_20554:2195-3010(+)